MSANNQTAIVTENETSPKSSNIATHKSRVADILVPKSYILRELQNKISNIEPNKITAIENYIKYDIPNTHLSHVSTDIKEHISILVEKLLPNTLCQTMVNTYIINIIQDIIQNAQIKVATKKQKKLAEPVKIKIVKARRRINLEK